jgi:4-hydroxy-tetrahydrodipicolinate synthase
MFKGSIPALITPFTNQQVDEPAFQRLCERQIAEGSHALVPVGTTGESATLTHAEHIRVIALCVEVAARRVPVIAGCGSNSTAEALSLIEQAKKVGADAALVVTPYYNKPSQEGLYQHFATLAEQGGLPIVLYNIPGRSSVDMSVETMARLAKLEAIVGVKDATGQLARLSAQRAACGADFVQLSGNDELTLGFMAMGGQGCISVSANVAPALCAAFQEACLAGDYKTALGLHERLFALHMALFSDASPGPTKYALQLLGQLPSAELRLPLTKPSPASQAAVRAALQQAGLLAS